MKRSLLAIATLQAALGAQIAFAATGEIQRGAFAVRADAAGMTEFRSAIENVNRAFAQYKESNDKALAELKANGHVSADAQAKLDRIDTDVSEIQAAIDKMAIQMAGGLGAGGSGVKDKEYSDAFRAHFIKGDVQASLNKGAAEEGGYLTPTEWDRTITNKLILVSPMRQICRVVPTGRASYSKLFNMRGTSSGWVGEEDERPNTGTAQFKSLTFAVGEIYANPAATQAMLDDGFIDVEAWLAEEVQTEFAKQEGVAFLTGNSDKMPSGLLTYIVGGANAAKHPLGAIATVDSGAANDVTADGVFDLVYELPAVYTANARFAMNRNAQRQIRKLKDNIGNYLWQPSLVAGQPATLAGYAITELPDMPDVAAGSTPLLYGDFNQTYLINDRVGVRVLRDPYTNKPFVSFYTTKRVGGGLLNPETMKAMKIGA
jgi:HK97 family phage major capsid protein